MTGQHRDDADRCARVGLARHVRPDARPVAELRRVGAVELWQQLVATRGQHWPDPAEGLARAAKIGARFVIPGDDEWPDNLSVLDVYAHAGPTPDRRANGRDLGPPFGLWARGGPLTMRARAVAVVGARAATSYGTATAMDLGTGLAERGYDVVSGAAYGIDAAAHRGALAAAGRTVAVLACGVDVPYPRAHEALLAVIARDGAVVSEAPLGEPPSRGAFLRRNRLIAAMTEGTALVEAGLRSGARNTVAHARALGRHRWIVPGPVTSAMSAGCHATLRTDTESKLVTCAAEVAEDAGRIGDLAPLPSGPADVRDRLGQRARDLLDVLPAQEVWSTSRVAAELQLSARELLVVLGALTEAGLLEQDGDGVRLSRLAREPTARTA